MIHALIGKVTAWDIVFFSSICREREIRLLRAAWGIFQPAETGISIR